MNLAQAEQEKIRRLNAMKRLATGLLLLMAVVFVVAHKAQESYAWLSYVRAFAEAAMIGALADWFAVTALFRHPMGLPIPHTAIIARRKDEIGESLAGFVRDNFLVEDALQPRMRGIDFAIRVGGWMSQPDNARRLAGDAGAFASWFLDVFDSTALRHFLRENLQLTMRQIQITPLVGRSLDLLTAGDHHQELINALTAVARRQLEQNKDRIRERIKTSSPWWLPKFVDQEIYDKLVAEFEELLDRVGDDSENEARQNFNDEVNRFLNALKNDPEVIARGERLKDELLSHPEVQQYFFDIWNDISVYLSRESADPNSRIRRKIETGIMQFGDALLHSPEMQKQVNDWISDVVLYVVGHYRDEISAVISDTVKRWDAEATSQRIEIQVGRDLQFIRINGTMVGGMVGLLIHTVIQLLA
ncbi:MAG: DUF445 domain-containing protein [Gammaproteobacteria bacterium]|nr:DUF445 domain-containing protein [Gammaproteobacteria bacterium]